MLNFILKHKKFPLFSLPADFINSAVQQLPLLIITSRFGPESVGLLAIVMRALGAPISLLGASILDVFKRDAIASLRDKGECREVYVSTFKILFCISIISSFIIYFAAESMFGILFGDKWSQAGDIAVLMLPLYAFRIVASPLGYMPYFVNKQHIDLIWQIALFILAFVALLIMNNLKETVALYSFSYAFMYLVYLIISYRLSIGSSNYK